MNRPMLAALAVALLSSGCVVRASGPRVIVTDPVPPPVVYAPPPPVVVSTPPPVVVAPVVVHPPILVSPPRVVIVPGTQVYTVPSASYNVFVYGGQYYSFHHGTGFHAPRHGAAWTPVAVAKDFPKVNLFTVDEMFGGWSKAQKEHFDDGTIYDQILAAAAKKT